MMHALKAPLRWSRSLYDWVISFGESRNAPSALFLLSLAEASFFPIPPDPLLIALCMGAHKKWLRFAAICSLGSVLGGMLGYLIGYAAYEAVGSHLMSLIASISGGNPEEMLETARYWFDEKEVWGFHVGAWAVGIAGFTPIPYKVFTIAAGFFEMNFVVFVIASAISRSLRFLVVAGLVGILYERYGPRITEFIDKYFNWLAILFVILLVGGFLIVKVV